MSIWDDLDNIDKVLDEANGEPGDKIERRGYSRSLNEINKPCRTCGHPRREHSMTTNASDTT